MSEGREGGEFKWAECKDKFKKGGRGKHIDKSLGENKIGTEYPQKLARKVQPKKGNWGRKFIGVKGKY